MRFLQLVIRDYVDYEIFTNLLAKVSEICKDGVCVVGHHSPALIPVWDALLDITTFPHSRNDCVVWKPSISDVFTLKLAYTAMDVPSNMVEWSNLVWFKGNKPVTFLHNRLSTLDRLIKWGICTDSSYLCGQGDEPVHLFFNCTFSSRV